MLIGLQAISTPRCVCAFEAAATSTLCCRSVIAGGEVMGDVIGDVIGDAIALTVRRALLSAARRGASAPSPSARSGSDLVISRTYTVKQAEGVPPERMRNKTITTKYIRV